MNKLLIALTVSGMTLGLTAPVFAQVVAPAPPPVAVAPNALTGAGAAGGLSTAAIAGVIGAVVVVGIAVGGGSDGVTTTTTTSP